MTRKRQVDWSNRVVQLDLWSALEVAEELPEDADLQEIWTSLDIALEALSMRAQLTLAGEVIARLAQIIQDRAWLTISELDQLRNTEGPVMPPGAFDRFVRQSMQIDFERFVEAPLVPPRRVQEVTQAEFPDDGRSVVVELDQAALLEALEAEVEFDLPQTFEQAISLAHSENVQEWDEAIQQCFASQTDQLMRFLELTRVIQERSQEKGEELGAISVQTWLALLLGDYQLEQRGAFYQAETLWARRVIEISIDSSGTGLLKMNKPY
ncbi:hypothetical protein ACKFKF_12815 [Phormidesmis sp. 146-12]